MSNHSHPTLLVSGATGLNGRELLKQLSQQGIPTRALVRDPARAADLGNDFIQLVEGDLSDPASLNVAFEGIEKAYIVTSINQDTVRWFQNFYAAAKRAGVKHLVKFSGYGSSEDSRSEVIRQHGESDRLLRESGLTYTILRPNSFYQNMLWQADSIMSQGEFYLPVGDARQSMVDVRDIAEATIRVLTEPGHENRVYDLTGPESLSFDDVAREIAAVSGKAVRYVPVSVADAKSSMLESGMPEWDADVLAEIQGVFGSGAYAKVETDLEHILGRVPRRFATFALDHAKSFEPRATDT